MAKYQADLYFKIELATLRRNDMIPFSLFLYLPANQHIVRVRGKGDMFDKDLSSRLKSSKQNNLYVLITDRAAYDLYVAPPKAFEVDRNEAQEIANSLSSKDKAAIEQGQELAEDLVKKLLATSEEWRDDLMELVGNPGAEHATNVAIYTVLFMIALGKTDSATLTDMAIAALIHDVGVTQVPLGVIGIPATKLRGEGLEEFGFHVQGGIGLLREFKEKPSKQVVSVLEQHHEKFDGTGYPRNLQGFKIQMQSQALAFADLCNSMMRGWYDGETRTLTKALELIQSIDKETTFPHYFNPDIFKKIVFWMTGEALNKHLAKANATAEIAKKKFLKAS